MLLLVPLIALAIGVGAWLGVFAAYGVALGVLSGTGAAPLVLPLATRLVVGSAMAAASVAGLWVADGPVLLVAGLVAVASLAQAPANRRSSGVAVMLPVLVAINAREGLPEEPLLLAGTVLVGYLAVQGLARVASANVEPRPVERGVARRHASALAVVAGTVAYLGVLAGLPHGYWLVLTVAFVLRPEPRESGSAAVERTIGTLVGVVVAIAIAIVAPRPVAMGAASLSVVLSVAFALQRDLRMQHAFLTPAIVLLGSSGLLLAQAELAAERLLLTVAGSSLAVLAAAVLHRIGPTPDEGLRQS